MTIQPQDSGVTKLLAMADNVAIEDVKYDAARNSGNENRQYGRLHKSITEMKKAADKVRAASEKVR